MTTYEFDTTLDPDYPVLTRGNAGEIMPDIVSPLSATVFFPPLERGWRRSFTETWDVMDWPDCPTTFAPIVGGRFYINISAFRRLADLTPGTSPDDIDRTLFAAGGIRLDPYEVPDEEGYIERGRADRRDNRRPSWRIHRSIASGGEHDAAQARRCEGRARGTSSSNAELLARFESCIPSWRATSSRLFIGSSVSPVALGSLQAGLVEVYGDEGYELGRQAVMGVGGIESADAGKAVASLAGLEGDEFEAAFERVLEQYGFRGVNEWEIASPSWEIRPDVLRRAVDAVRAGGAERDPDTVRTAAAREVRGRRRPRQVPGARSVAGTLHGVDRHPRADQGHVRADHQRNAARRTRDRSTAGRRRQARVGRPGLLADVRRVTAPQLAAATSTSIGARPAGGPGRTWCGIRSRCSRSPGRFPQSRNGRKVGGDATDAGDQDEVIGAAGSPGSRPGRARVVMDAYADEPTDRARCWSPRSRIRGGCRCSSVPSPSSPRWAASSATR